MIEGLLLACWRRRLATFTIVLALTPATLWGTEQPKLATVDKVIEITGGSTHHAWKLRYARGYGDETHLALVGANRAYFSHGSWLRLIDTERGVVIGRWSLPGSITHIEPTAGGAKLEITRDGKCCTWLRRCCS